MVDSENVCFLMNLWLLKLKGLDTVRLSSCPGQETKIKDVGNWVISLVVNGSILGVILLLSNFAKTLVFP